ncbi:MAG TPA: acetate uptake transporter [Rhodanobacteraceae bacterium]
MNVQANVVGEGRIFLQPIAAPSILGLFGFAGATFMVGTYLAGWYGGANALLYIFPFALTFGGIAQFTAGMWCYKARDGIGTAMHGLWGSFWLAYGFMYALFAAGILPKPVGASVPLAYWFIVLCVITFSGAWASLWKNKGLFCVLATLSLASAIMAAYEYSGVDGLKYTAGWIFFFSALIAWYTATAMLLESAAGKTVLSLGMTRHAEVAPDVDYGVGEPGVKHGQ